MTKLPEFRKAEIIEHIEYIADIDILMHLWVEKDPLFASSPVEEYNRLMYDYEQIVLISAEDGGFDPGQAHMLKAFYDAYESYVSKFTDMEYNLIDPNRILNDPEWKLAK